MVCTVTTSDCGMILCWRSQLEKLPYSRNVYVSKALTTGGSVRIRVENGNGFRQNSRRSAGFQPSGGNSTRGENGVQPRRGSTAGRAAAAGRLCAYA